MEKLIQFCESEISHLETSIQRYRDLTTPFKGCTVVMTARGLEGVARQVNELNWYRNEVSMLKDYQDCKCFILHKIISFSATILRKYTNSMALHQCPKCSGYFVKRGLLKVLS